MTKQLDDLGNTIDGAVAASGCTPDGLLLVYFDGGKILGRRCRGAWQDIGALMGEKRIEDGIARIFDALWPECEKKMRRTLTSVVGFLSGSGMLAGLLKR